MSQRGDSIGGGSPHDMFGRSVALSADGETLAVGARDASYVHVYTRNGSGWTLRARVDGEAGGQHFGNSVALSADGETLAVGTPLNPGNGSSAGHVRVYVRDGWSWTQLGADIDGEAAGDQSGYVAHPLWRRLLQGVGGVAAAHVNGVDLRFHLLGGAVDGHGTGQSAKPKASQLKSLCSLARARLVPDRRAPHYIYPPRTAKGSL